MLAARDPGKSGGVQFLEADGRIIAYDLSANLLFNNSFSVATVSFSSLAKEGPKTDQKRFPNIEQSLTYELEFAHGLKAKCKCSYSEELDLLRADAEEGWFELSPAFEYSGIKGATSSGTMDFPQVNQQAIQMDAIARYIIERRPSPVPGEMGMQDVGILTAIYEAMNTGKRIQIR